MSNQIIRQEEKTEQQQQQIIKQLKQSIQLSHHEMHELVSNQEQFVERITQFNNLSKQKIKKKTQLQISGALVYLSQAEKILQYAAGCGKNINRQLIICVLHNQACVYQILWQLEECSNYLQALIYNYECFFKQSNQFSVPPSYLNPSSHSQINMESQKMFGFAGGSQISYTSRMKDPNLISKNQLKLLIYYYEHCAVSSQLQTNKKALQSAKKAIKILKQSFSQQKSHLFQLMRQNNKYNKNQNIEEKYFLLVNLSEMFQKINLSQHKQILKSAHFSLQIWSKNRSLYSNSQIKSKQEELLIEKVKNLAIGSIMEIVPKQFNKFTNEAFSDQEDHGILTIDQYTLRIFFLSVGYFSAATQLRLLANLLYKNRKQEEKKNSLQYRQSIIYHLIAIIIAAIYIPYECHYILDILASYSKHYASNLEQYKPVEQQSIQKILVLLGFKKEQTLTQKNKFNQKLGRSTKQTTDQQKSVEANEYNMQCKSPTFKKNNINKKKQCKDKDNQKLEKSKKLNQCNDLRNSKISKSRVDSKNSRMKRSHSRQTVNIKDKVQKKYSELQKILSCQNLIEIEKSPIKKLKSNDKSHLSKDKIHTKKVTQKQKQQIKRKLKSDKKLKTQRKTKISQKQQENKLPKQNTITEDEQFFFFMTKKTTKTQNNNQNLFSPKQSLKSIGSSRKTTGKKSSLHSSRSNSKNSPKVFANIHSPISSAQSPLSKGFNNIRKINSDKKSGQIKMNSPSNHTQSHKHYF